MCEPRLRVLGMVGLVGGDGTDGTHRDVMRWCVQVGEGWRGRSGWDYMVGVEMVGGEMVENEMVVDG